MTDAVLRKIVEGTGVSSVSWPAGTPKETVLQWLDEQLGAARTPFGISGAKVTLSRERMASPWIERFLPERKLWWLTMRDEVAMALEGLLVKEEVTTTVVAVGTALDAVWHDRGR